MIFALTLSHLGPPYAQLECACSTMKKWILSPPYSPSVSTMSPPQFLWWVLHRYGEMNEASARQGCHHPQFSSNQFNIALDAPCEPWNVRKFNVHTASYCFKRIWNSVIVNFHLFHAERTVCRLDCFVNSPNCWSKDWEGLQKGFPEIWRGVDGAGCSEREQVDHFDDGGAPCRTLPHRCIFGILEPRRLGSLALVWWWQQMCRRSQIPRTCKALNVYIS